MSEFKANLRNAKRGNCAFCAGFTLVELLVVIVIIGILSSLLVGLAGTVSEKQKISAAKGELGRLQTAISSYKTSMNFFPPDHYDPITRTVNAVTNQLFYELTGTYYRGVMGGNTGGRPVFSSAYDDSRMDTSYIKLHFGRDGFANAADNTNSIKKYITVTGKQVGELALANDFTAKVLVSPVSFKKGSKDATVKDATGVGLEINPWHYVSTSPTNNPSEFDLWTEFVIGKKRVVISNWKN